MVEKSERMILSMRPIMRPALTVPLGGNSYCLVLHDDMSGTLLSSADGRPAKSSSRMYMSLSQQ